jgi:hypothetical protein
MMGMERIPSAPSKLFGSRPAGKTGATNKPSDAIALDDSSATLRIKQHKR